MSISYGFLHLIKSVTDLPPVQENKFRDLISVIPVKKGENYIRAGESPRKIAFVRDGLFRYYYTSEDGIESTKGFFDQKECFECL